MKDAQVKEAMAEDYASISDSFIFGYLLRFVFIGDNNNAYY